MSPPESTAVPFAKYSGAGNDFVIVDAADLGASDPSGLAARICPRRTGVGVDGLALVESLGSARVGVRFFNPDGSEFGTCGNGTRCVALWALDRGLADRARLRIETSDGGIDARAADGTVGLDYRLGARIDRELDVPVGGSARRAWLVRMGTPHLVVPLPELPDGAIDEMCRPLRHLSALGPEGANVDLVTLEDEHDGAVRTFERGVEGETLACGSGAMAVALALHAAGRTAPELRLRTRSGDELTVTLLGPAGRGPEGTIRLAGPARRIFEGRFPAGR